MNSGFLERKKKKLLDDRMCFPVNHTDGARHSDCNAGLTFFYTVQSSNIGCHKHYKSVHSVTVQCSLKHQTVSLMQDASNKTFTSTSVTCLQLVCWVSKLSGGSCLTSIGMAKEA